MLAPKEVTFYGRAWNRLGSLAALAEQVSEVTKIHVEALTKERSIWSYSVAQRMCWASQRNSTRVEDAAYSLLGILHVNLGIIYGEGKRAFRRLQEEFLRTNYDQSIFVYNTGTLSPKSRDTGDWVDLLAKSPSDFSGSGNVVAFPYSGHSSCKLMGMEVAFKLPVVDRDHHEIQTVLACGLEDNCTKVAVLNVRKYSAFADTYCCHTDRPRVEMIDVSEVPWKCADASFSVVLRASRLDAEGIQGSCILLCRSRSRCSRLVGMASPSAKWRREAHEFDFRKPCSFVESCQLDIYRDEKQTASASITWPDFPYGRPNVDLDGLQVSVPMIRCYVDYEAVAFQIWTENRAVKWHNWGVITAGIVRSQFGPEGRAPRLLVIDGIDLRHCIRNVFRLSMKALMQGLYLLVRDTGFTLPAALSFRQLGYSWRLSIAFGVFLLLAAHVMRGIEPLLVLRPPFSLTARGPYTWHWRKYGSPSANRDRKFEDVKIELFNARDT